MAATKMRGNGEANYSNPAVTLTEINLAHAAADTYAVYPL